MTKEDKELCFASAFFIVVFVIVGIAIFSTFAR